MSQAFYYNACLYAAQQEIHITTRRANNAKEEPKGNGCAPKFAVETEQS